MGCLRAMAVRAGCSVLLAVALALGIVYRRQIWDYYREWRGTSGEVWVAPSANGTAEAQAALDRLARSGGPAYVDIRAGALAALVDAALARSGRRVLDSVQVALLENEIRVRGSLDLTGVPRNLLGPLSGVVNDHEPAAIGGPLSVDSGGRLILTVSYLRVREFPFPKSTIPRILMEAHIPGADGPRVPLPGVSRAGDVRVSPSRVRFYRSSPQ